MMIVTMVMKGCCVSALQNVTCCRVNSVLIRFLQIFCYNIRLRYCVLFGGCL